MARDQKAYLKEWRSRPENQDYFKDYYAKHKAEFDTRNLNKKKAVRAFVNDLKSKPCSDCHRTYPPYVMDFDHRDPSLKIDRIGALTYRASWTLLLAELPKCDLVCANCHRIRTYQQRRRDTGETKPRKSLKKRAAQLT